MAQHSCVVSDFLAATGAPGHVVRAGLLHDAGEAYVGDLKSPLRTAKFDRIEAGVLRAVGERFGFELDRCTPRSGTGLPFQAPGGGAAHLEVVR